MPTGAVTEGAGMTMSFDLIVVGEGVAGLTCAAEATRLGLSVGTYEAAFLGGLVANVDELRHFDGADGLSGLDFAGSLAVRNKKAGVKSVNAGVTAIRAAGDLFEVEAGSTKHTARSVVIASGAHLRKLGVPGEAEFEGRGVSHCADCDAPLFTGADVVVAGGGDWALQSALVLAQECSTVHVVFEDDAPTACEDYVRRAGAELKIALHPGLTVVEIVGNDSGMTGVRTRDGQGGVRELPALGLFALVGLQPNSDLVPAGMRRDHDGHIVVDKTLGTSIPGLWAIGQVRSGFGGWLNDAVSDARRAAEGVRARTA